mgnify:CR=1 FL=1
MFALRDFAARQLKITPRQFQIFTPTPSTYSSLMYYTETDPFTGEALLATIQGAGMPAFADHASEAVS